MQKNSCSKKVRIVDVDDTLLEFISPLAEYHNVTYGTKLKFEDFFSYSLESVWGGTREEAQKKILDFYKHQLFENVPPVQGALEAVVGLSTNSELYIVTSRLASLEDITKRQIAENFNGYFKKIYFSKAFFNTGKTKSELCLELEADMIFEDCLQYAVECAQAGVNVILLDKPWNQGETPLGVYRVRDWEEAVEKVREIDG